MATDLDDILQELGQFGRYQIITYMLISLPMVFAIVTAHSFVFTSGDMNYRCRIPECGDLDEEFRPEWLNRTVPMEQRTGISLPKRCHRYEAVSPNVSTPEDSCPADMFTNRTVRCHEWVWEGEEYTIAREFNLTCDESTWMLTLSGSLIYGGILISRPLTGFVSDRWGRRFALLGGLVLTCFTGILRSFSLNYIMYQICNLAEGIVGGGIYATGFVMGLELMGPKKRVLGGAIMSTYNPMAELIMGSISWYLQSWRLILRVVYIPSLLFISYYWLLPESVRWLMAKGKMAKAEKIILKAAKVNGVVLSENYFKSLTSLHSMTDLANKKPPQPKTDKGNHITQMMSSKILLWRLITCSFCWTSIAFVFAGMTFNATTLAGNKYLNYILTGVIELPTPIATYYCLNKLGRKVSLCGSLIISGICNFAFIAVPEDMLWLRIVLYLAGKFSITISFDVIYIFAVEMFPTELRQSMLAACSVLGGLGPVAAPQVPLLAQYMEALPLLLFGGTSVASGVLALFLPETMGTKLPDTIEEAENLGRKRRQAPKDTPAQGESEGLKTVESDGQKTEVP